MKRIFGLVAAAVLMGTVSPVAMALEWIKRPALTLDAASKKWHVIFELDSLSDV